MRASTRSDHWLPQKACRFIDNSWQRMVEGSDAKTRRKGQEVALGKVATAGKDFSSLLGLLAVARCSKQELANARSLG